jgi:hypothetical protein
MDLEQARIESCRLVAWSVQITSVDRGVAPRRGHRRFKEAHVMANPVNKDYYKTLGVRENASIDEIKRAFHRLARRFHPDVKPGNRDAEARFREINEAYSVLADPEKRKQYDARILRRATRPRQGHRPAHAQYAHRAGVEPGTASGRFGRAGESHPRQGRVVVDLDLTVAGLSAGLRLVDTLIGGLGRALTSAGKAGSQRRPPPGVRSHTDRNS